MWQPSEDNAFWIAVIGATVVKLMSSPYHSFARAILTGFAAIFAAYIFTDSVVDWLKADPKVYQIPVAALLALTGEGLMRTIIDLSNNPQRLLEWWKTWRK